MPRYMVALLVTRDDGFTVRDTLPCSSIHTFNVSTQFQYFPTEREALEAGRFMAAQWPALYRVEVIVSEVKTVVEIFPLEKAEKFIARDGYVEHVAYSTT